MASRRPPCAAAPAAALLRTARKWHGSGVLGSCGLGGVQPACRGAKCAHTGDRTCTLPKMPILAGRSASRDTGRCTRRSAARQAGSREEAAVPSAWPVCALRLQQPPCSEQHVMHTYINVRLKRVERHEYSFAGGPHAAARALARPSCPVSAAAAGIKCRKHAIAHAPCCAFRSNSFDNRLRRNESPRAKHHSAVCSPCSVRPIGSACLLSICL